MYAIIGPCSVREDFAEHAVNETAEIFCPHSLDRVASCELRKESVYTIAYIYAVAHTAQEGTLSQSEISFLEEQTLIHRWY